MGQKVEKEDVAGGKKKKEEVLPEFVFKVDVNCDCEASNIKRWVKRFPGVMDVTVDKATLELRVTGDVNPWKLGDYVKAKTGKTLDIISPVKPSKKQIDCGDKKPPAAVAAKASADAAKVSADAAKATADAAKATADAAKATADPDAAKDAADAAKDAADAAKASAVAAKAATDAAKATGDANAIEAAAAAEKAAKAAVKASAEAVKAAAEAATAAAEAATAAAEAAKADADAAAAAAAAAAKSKVASTVVLQIRRCCNCCNKRIKDIILKVEGVKAAILDEEKDLVTIKGTIDVNSVVAHLKEKLKNHEVKVVSF